LTSDLARFKDALNRTLGANSNSIQRILDIGCGRGEECLALRELFERADIVAIDLDEDAARAAGSLLSTASRIEVVHGNAITLAGNAATHNYDLIVARHPDVDRRPQNWINVLRFMSDHVSATGTIVLTAYTVPEATFVNNYMESLGHVLLDGSPYSAVPVAMTGADRYVLLYRSLSASLMVSSGDTTNA